VDNSQVLVVAAVNGGEERIVARQDARKNWFALWDSGPSWSPDGQRIAFCGGQHDPAGDRQVIFDVQLSDGSMTVMHAPPWKDISQVVWLAGSTSLAVVAASADSPAAQIWLLAYPSGTARRITNDVNDYGKLKVSAESRQLVVEQTVSLNHIWVMREGDEPHAKQLTFGTNNSDGLYGLSWTPDGRLLFVSNRTGELEIWSMSADGSNARQLTVHSSGPNRTPKATPDGRYIVFASTRSGKQHIWRMDADGSHPIPLTSGNSHVSPDGRWVYYTNLDVVPSVIERISIDGGSPVRIGNTEAGGKPMVSPDGKRIVYNHFDDVRGWRNAIVSVDNGELHVFDWNGERGIAQWRPDGRAIIYGTRTINSNLWMQPADGGAPRPITDFKEGHIWNFAISPDGRDYAIYRGTTMNDIVLIKDFM
jgi:Tol biopolymer transport system component